jgi:hypothetical protein
LFPFANEEHALIAGLSDCLSDLTASATQALTHSSIHAISLKRRHLFDRYSIVFPFFSVSQRENDGKHIGKR